MKFTFNGVEYRIEFQYDTKKKGKKVRNYTFARIKTGDRETEQIVAEGKVARYQYDKFDKEHARQYALETALEVLQLAQGTFEVGTFVRSLVLPEGGNRTLTQEEVDTTVQKFASTARAAYHRRQGGLDYERAVRKGLVTVKVPAAPESLSFQIQTA